MTQIYGNRAREGSRSGRRRAYSTTARQHNSTTCEKLWSVNWAFVVVMTLIAGCGIGALYSVAGGSFEPFAGPQAVRYLSGLFLFFSAALIGLRFWLRAAYPLYLAALLLLALVPWLGLEHGGARRWLSLGVLTVQPSEFLKITLVLALARYYQRLSGRPRQGAGQAGRRWRQSLTLLAPVAMIAVPTLLVMRQPDLGTAVLIVGIGGGVLFLAGVGWPWFLSVFIAVAAAAPFVWEYLHGYQKDRLLTFIDPGRDPLGAGYHILQSKIALGAGGLWGRGFVQGTQSQLNFLPEKHTDFIFAIIAEEFGFAGALGLLGLYLLALVSLTYMALRCRSVFGRLLAGGIALSFFFPVFINIAMVTGLVPVVGLPLPLVSYGGTSMLALMFGLGLAMSAYVHRHAEGVSRRKRPIAL